MEEQAAARLADLATKIKNAWSTLKALEAEEDPELAEFLMADILAMLDERILIRQVLGVRAASHLCPTFLLAEALSSWRVTQPGICVSEFLHDDCNMPSAMLARLSRLC